jgi:hypothetical protein
MTHLGMDQRPSISITSRAVQLQGSTSQLAEKDNDRVNLLGSLTLLGNVLHHQNRLAEAERYFLQAENLQAEIEPELPFLYSIRGFHYCDLLLSLGRSGEVRERMPRIVEVDTRQRRFIDVAIDKVVLGRAYLEDPTHDHLTRAGNSLNDAVDTLREKYRPDYLPIALIARAGLHRHQSRFADAEHDLCEAHDTIDRCGLRLFGVDCLLERVRLQIARGDRIEARKTLIGADELVRAIPYRLKEKEISRLGDTL